MVKQEYTIKDVVDIGRFFMSAEYKISKHNLNDFEYEEVHGLEIDECADMKAEDLEQLFQLELLGNGCYRAVYKFNEKLALKFTLDNGNQYLNRRELVLYNYVKREKPNLLKFLCPIVGYYDDVLIVPVCYDEYNITNQEIYAIAELFEKEGILIGDLDRKCQFSKFKGQTVILDYADWVFTWKRELQRHNFKRRMALRND